MSDPSLPQLEPAKEGFRIRLRYGQGKQGKFFICLRDEAAATRRAARLRELAGALRELPPAEAAVILKSAAEARSEAVFAVICKAAIEELQTPPKTKHAPVTFAQLAEQWTSGEIHRRHPLHVKKKSTSDLDAQRFEVLNKEIGGVPVASFTLADAKRAMSKIPEGLAPATQRQYAQLIAKVLKLAVWPLELIPVSPLPQGFLPKVGKRRAKAWLYPSEDRLLMEAPCSKVPLDRRVLYGFLAREGLRLSEALGLTWDAVDLERGVLRLDDNKTDDPRAWAMDRGVLAALKLFRPASWKGTDVIFSLPFDPSVLARVFREDLKAAGVDRAELFDDTEQRMAIRVHDLRGTFVTLALANGKTETWVSDRTGHRTSDMINTYRRAARSATELALGELVPLVGAIPEFRKGPQGESEGESGRVLTQDENHPKQLKSLHKPKWRNRQTQRIQNPPGQPPV